MEKQKRTKHPAGFCSLQIEGPVCCIARPLLSPQYHVVQKHSCSQLSTRYNRLLYDGNPNENLKEPGKHQTTEKSQGVPDVFAHRAPYEHRQGHSFSFLASKTSVLLGESHRSLSRFHADFRSYATLGLEETQDLISYWCL